MPAHWRRVTRTYAYEASPPERAAEPADGLLEEVPDLVTWVSPEVFDELVASLDEPPEVAELVHDLIAEDGEPSAEDYEWADRVLDGGDD